tara:strand:+ start:3820 stop:4662 length:843 start_codon:yes stop_codon:yes gene_type:complete
MATKKLSKSEIKKGKCSYPDPPDEGLPIWMGTFADMMTLLFAFFVLLFSMSTLDPVKYSAFQNANADKTGGTAEGSQELSQAEIKSELQSIVDDTAQEIKEKLKNSVESNSNLSDMQKEAKIAEIEEDDQLKVTHDPRGVALEIDGEICFGSGSTDLKEEVMFLLDEASKLMIVPNDSRAILIEGHTDNDELPLDLQKKFGNNWGLSADRASKVVTYLIEQNNVAQNRLRVVGYADQWPADATWTQSRSGEIDKEFIAKSNQTPEKKAKNRRIKIIFATS